MSGRSSPARPVAVRRRWMDSWSTSSPSSSSMKVAWNSKALSLLPTGLEAREGFLDSCVVRKDPVEGGELEHHADLLVRRGEPQLTLSAADLLQRRDHGTEPCGVDEADALHVDDHLRRAVLDAPPHAVFPPPRAR